MSWWSHAGLTKSSEQLRRVWEADPELYMVTLKGAIAAYEESKSLEGLLVTCIARLASVVDRGDEAVDRAIEIVVGSEIVEN